MTGSEDAFDAIDPRLMSKIERYKLLTATVIPRPIAFVTTSNDDGTVNAAPFSQFIIVSTAPGMLGFSSGVGRWGKKDTVINIERSGEFVINTVPEDLARTVQECAEELPRNVSEVARTGLRLLRSETIAVPRIAASHVQFECRLERIVEFGTNSLVVGLITRVHARAGLVRDGKVDPREFRPLGRIAGRRYCTIGEMIEV